MNPIIANAAIAIANTQRKPPIASLSEVNENYRAILIEQAEAAIRSLPPHILMRLSPAPPPPPPLPSNATTEGGK